ncbi:hypothetical protein CYMTET_47812 [Cymbomonas tetramitiformis]|uniref:SWIM-type domain-containing protein n=1 Tax=Cymbomonas tetramitiformis TaxID=36881 RepID=A0AAE0BTF8_9CHLO|nr:hypothetical protein CYMTET_47812 [Cymbomonas tetramitiformis]
MATEGDIEWASPGNLNNIYHDDTEEEEDEEHVTMKKRIRKNLIDEERWVYIYASVTSEDQCRDKIRALCPEGFCRATTPYTSKKHGDITTTYRCSKKLAHHCELSFKIRSRVCSDGIERFSLSQKGAHTHGEFYGKQLDPKVKEKVVKLILDRKQPRQIWEALQKDPKMPATSYKTVKAFVKNHRGGLLAEFNIKTYSDLKEVALSHNLLFLHRADASTNGHTAGILAFFDNDILSADGFTRCDRFPASTTLPPLPHEAEGLLELLGKWKKSKWNGTATTMQQALNENIRTIGNNASAPFFLDLLKNLLGASGWNFKKNAFHTRELNVQGFYKSFKLLIEDYGAQVNRRRFVVLFTTLEKLKLFVDFNMLQRDDVYKLLWNQFPVETGGTSENRRYSLGYLAVKSHEDAIASEIVNTLLVHAIYHLEDKLWCPRTFGLDHSFAFYNANLTFPDVVSWMCHTFHIPPHPHVASYIAGEVKLLQAICYAHCQRKVNDKKHFFLTAENYQTFKRDVGLLRRMWDPTAKYGEGDALADAALRLLVTKFGGKDETYITEWFENFWCGKWGTWRDGSLPAGKPTHNNGPECYHNLAQKFLAKRTCLPFGQFVSEALIFMHRESVRDSENPLQEYDAIELHTWRKGLLLLESHALEYTMKSTANDGRIVYLMPSEKTYKSLEGMTAVDKKRALATQAALYMSLVKTPTELPPTISSFDDFQEAYFSFRILEELVVPKEAYYYYSCSCHEYLVAKVCEHTLAFGVYKEKFKAPIERNLDLIGRQPQIGRPPKPRHALVRQPGPDEKVSLTNKRKLAKRAKQGGDASNSPELDLAFGSQQAPPTLKCQICKKTSRARSGFIAWLQGFLPDAFAEHIPKAAPIPQKITESAAVDFLRKLLSAPCNAPAVEEFFETGQPPAQFQQLQNPAQIPENVRKDMEAQQRYIAELQGEVEKRRNDIQKLEQETMQQFADSDSDNTEEFVGVEMEYDENRGVWVHDDGEDDASPAAYPPYESTFGQPESWFIYVPPRPDADTVKHQVYKSCNEFLERVMKLLKGVEEFLYTVEDSQCTRWRDPTTAKCTWRWQRSTGRTCNAFGAGSAVIWWWLGRGPVPMVAVWAMWEAISWHLARCPFRVWWRRCVASLLGWLPVWWSAARRYPRRAYYDVWVLWALACIWYVGLLVVRATGIYAGVHRVRAEGWMVVPLRGVVVSLACWSQCAAALLITVLAWLWVCASVYAEDVACHAPYVPDDSLDTHHIQRGRGWAVPSLRWSQVFLLGRVRLPALPARLDKPRFAARWAQLRRNLRLHCVAQAAYVALILAVVVFTAAGGSTRLAHGGWRVMACFFASNSPAAAVHFNRILRFFLLLCGILWVAGKLAESVPMYDAMSPTRSAWGASPCTSWEAQQSSRQWEPGWEANAAEQDEVLPYTVLDELQPLGDTTVTKDEAAWLDTELNATFGGHPDFKEEHWEEMRNVLRRCKATFANSPHDLTGYKGKAEHNTFSIPFIDESKAAYQRPREYSPGEQEIIDIHCKELLEYGFIEPAAKHCRHASNVVVAGKKDHETGLWTQTRFCVDLRGVNRHSLKDNTLPHRPEELYQKVAKAKFKTTLDATKAFHQIPMATEEDRSKTAFWWKNQLYQYTSMPFGAAGATSAFVRIMDYELRHLQHCTVAYVDDVVVYTDSTPEQHLKDVEDVLRTLGDAGIRLHAGKSTFGAATVDFLGYRIGHNSIGAQEAKCKAIQELPRPQDKTGLRSILGMMNYYKGLVGEPGGPNYSEMARPLNDLLKKEITDIKGAWGKDQDRALQELKDALCSGRCLRPIDYDRPLILYTDWSTYGIGAVLGQKDDDGKEYICMAISRSLSKTERQYASFKGEMLAVVWAVRTLRQYLHGVHFTLVTDHSPLTTLMEKADLQGQHLRWAISLQEFDFTVQYRPGAKNSNADVPSRYPLPTTTDETGARHEREKVTALHAGVGEVRRKDFRDHLCFMLAGEVSPGDEVTPEVQVANYCKRVAVEQLGTGPVHRLFDLHHQEELECNQAVMFDTDLPELVIDSGRLARAAWKALSLSRPTRGTHGEGSPAVYSNEYFEGERILKPEKVDTRVLNKQFFSQAREEGVVCYEPCGGLCAGLEMLLRSGMKVDRYLYQDISPSSQAVARARPGTKIRDEVFPYIASVIGRPVSFDAAQAGAYAHRLRAYWSNLFQSHQFRSVMSKVARLEGRVVSSILSKGWQPRPVIRTDRAPHYVVNVVGEPLRALPTIMATQGSRAFRKARMGTVVRNHNDEDIEEESREGYGTVDGGRRSKQEGLPHSEESLEAENSPGQPIAVDNNWADHARSDLQQRQALLAEWVENSNAYTQQVAKTMSHRDWEEKLQPMCSQGQKGAEGIGAQQQKAGTKKKKKKWQLHAIEQYRRRHESHFVKEGATPAARVNVPAWSPPAKDVEIRLPRLACTTRLADLMASVAEQQADREKHRDVHDDAWCLRWLRSNGSVKLPGDEVHRVRRRAARHRWDEATDEIYMITLSGKEVRIPKPADRLALVKWLLPKFMVLPQGPMGNCGFDH